MRRITTLITALSLALAGLGLAQTFEPELVEPIGDLTTSYEPYDVADAGAIILTHSTPTDQHANFDVVGPYDFWQRFDFSDDEGQEYVLDNLAPGMYSIAATDEGLELVHTVVEVRAGEAVVVVANLVAREQAFTEGAYDPYATYGYTSLREDGLYPGYPYGAYTVGPYGAHDQADAGVIALQNVPDGVDVVITGPDGYSEAFESDAVTNGLVPGTYVLAASGAQTDLAVTTLEVRAGQQLPTTPSASPLGGAANPNAGARVSRDLRGMTDGLNASFDANNDGRIEVADFQTGVFDLWDANDDDLLAEGEFTEAVDVMYGGDAPFAYGDLDADGDGVVTISEFQQGFDTGLYESFDADADGTITTEEFGAAFHDVLDVDDDGTIIADEYRRFEAWVGQTFADLDANADGTVDATEFTNSL